ncbi:MAG: SAM-dependent methyltransferase [uncultured bacterium]|nr:MAG: SAM-dependent methyltransferase [uncultured bacterium]
MIPKIKLLLNTIINIKNPLIYYKDFFGLIDKNATYLLKLKNKLLITLRANTPDRGIFNEIFYYKFYNPKNFEIYNNDTIVDVGAHIGLFGLYATSCAKNVKVYCFEPSIINYQLLNKNIMNNNLQLIKTFNLAVNNSNKKEKLYLDNSNDSHGFYSKSIDNQFTTVNCISLEKIIENNKIKKINLLKMDCEGCEYNILYNLPNKIFEIIEKIVFEVHIKKSNHDPDNLIKFLSKKGYKVNKKEWIIYAKKIKQ